MTEEAKTDYRTLIRKLREEQIDKEKIADIVSHVSKEIQQAYIHGYNRGAYGEDKDIN